MKLVAFAGALREASLNRQLLRLATRILEADGVEIDRVELRALAIPFYDGDLEAGPGLPAGAQELAAHIRAADGLVLASPEYNFSMPALVKNAIDWLSRAKPMGGRPPVSHAEEVTTMTKGDSSPPAPGALDNAGVIARPPLLYLTSIATGVALEWLRPLPLVPESFERVLGIPVVIASIALFSWGVREFGRAGTNIPTNLPSLRIVRSGPYRFSRNPIYLGFSGFQLGLALWLNGGWLLAMLAIVLLVMRFGVIAREERYLERKFGDEYRRYRAEVRRWL